MVGEITGNATAKVGGDLDGGAAIELGQLALDDLRRLVASGEQPVSFGQFILAGDDFADAVLPQFPFDKIDELARRHG